MWSQFEDRSFESDLFRTCAMALYRTLPDVIAASVRFVFKHCRRFKYSNFQMILLNCRHFFTDRASGHDTKTIFGYVWGTSCKGKVVSDRIKKLLKKCTVKFCTEVRTYVELRLNLLTRSILSWFCTIVWYVLLNFLLTFFIWCLGVWSALWGADWILSFSLNLNVESR